MAYQDLAQLANDPTFVGRVAYAAVHYATYLAGNDSSNIYQITWAEYTTADSGITAAHSVMPTVLQDPAVVAQMGAIPDEELQPIVEVACQALIEAQTPYEVLYHFAVSPAFLQRVQVAVVTFAEYVIKEDPTTPSHSVRYAWAKNAMLQQASVAQQIAMGVAQDPVISEVLNTATDVQIQTATEAQINLLLLT